MSPVCTFARRREISRNMERARIRKSIAHLQDLDILRETTGKQRGRLFVYDSYLSILSRGTEPLGR